VSSKPQDAFARPEAILPSRSPVPPTRALDFVVGLNPRVYGTPVRPKPRTKTRTKTKPAQAVDLSPRLLLLVQWEATPEEVN
jgi:hypothetical protein